MKILVTGATGFVGSHLCCRLLRDGHQVTILRRPTSDISLLKDADLFHIIGDVTDAESVRRAVKGQEVVIHAAAQIGDSTDRLDLQMKTNVEGTRNVALACKQQGARLLHLSSIAAIGIPSEQDQPADETFKFNLGNRGLNYHLSKKCAEDVVLDETAHGLDAVIVNPSSIGGPFGNQFRGDELPKKVSRNKIVFYFRGGANVVHIDDVVDGIIRALGQGRSGERYILGGENLTWYQMSEIAAQVLGVKRIFLPAPRAATALAAFMLAPVSRLTRIHPPMSSAAHDYVHQFHFYTSIKAQRELGYNPRGYREIVDEYFTWARGRR